MLTPLTQLLLLLLFKKSALTCPESTALPALDFPHGYMEGGGPCSVCSLFQPFQSRHVEGDVLFKGRAAVYVLTGLPFPCRHVQEYGVVLSKYQLFHLSLWKGRELPQRASKFNLLLAKLYGGLQPNACACMIIRGESQDVKSVDLLKVLIIYVPISCSRDVSI